MRISSVMDISPGFPVPDSFRAATREGDPGLRYVRPFGTGQLVLMCHPADPERRPLPTTPRFVFRLERIPDEKRSVSKVFATNETRDADAFMQLMSMTKDPAAELPTIQAIFLDRHPRIVQAYLRFMDLDARATANRLLSRQARGNCMLRQISQMIEGPDL